MGDNLGDVFYLDPAFIQSYTEAPSVYVLLATYTLGACAFLALLLSIILRFLPNLVKSLDPFFYTDDEIQKQSAQREAVSWGLFSIIVVLSLISTVGVVAFSHSVDARNRMEEGSTTHILSPVVEHAVVYTNYSARASLISSDISKCMCEDITVASPGFVGHSTKTCVKDDLNCTVYWDCHNCHLEHGSAYVIFNSPQPAQQIDWSFQASFGASDRSYIHGYVPAPTDSYFHKMRSLLQINLTAHFSVYSQPPANGIAGCLLQFRNYKISEAVQEEHFPDFSPDTNAILKFDMYHDESATSYVVEGGWLFSFSQIIGIFATLIASGCVAARFIQPKRVPITVVRKNVQVVKTPRSPKI